MTNMEPIAGYPSKEVMFDELYNKEGLSVTQLARRLDVSHTTILHWMDELGIQRRQRGGPNMPGKLLWRVHRLDPRDVWNQPNAVVAIRIKGSVSIVYKYIKGMEAVWSSAL